MPRMLPSGLTEPKPSGMGADLAAEALRQMLKIRLTEELIAAKYGEQQMRCPVHLSIGQEAPAVGVCLALRNDDCVVSTHRCHAHYLAKGGDVHRMLAELYGRATGCSKGKGGSMHLVDPSVGMMGSSAVLGGTVPLAVGLALSFKLRKEDRVAVAFLGDGATEQGSFYESLHLATKLNLPIVFAVENNEYATLSHISARRPAHVPIGKISELYQLAGHADEIDGTNLSEVYTHASAAVQAAREGRGPSLLVSRAYRWKEHVGPNGDNIPGGRDAEELAIWKQIDPITRWCDAMRAAGMLPTGRHERIRVEDEINAAHERALSDPFPEVQDLYEGV